MISLKDYIAESIDVDNLAWKVETYFKNKPEQYKQLMKLVKKQQENFVISDEEIDEFLEKSKVNIKKFIDFLSEEIDDETKDYKYLLKKVIENLVNKNNNETI